MNNFKKYIGGEFCESDLNLTDKGDFSVYFSEEKLFYFETGSDSLSYILNSFSKNNLSVWIPNNYCVDTIHRVQNKLKHKNILLKKYNSLNFLVGKIKYEDIILFVHFNKFDKNGQDEVYKLIKNNKIFLIEDFVQAPIDIKHHKGNASFNSFRKFIPLELSLCYFNIKGRNTTKKPSNYFIKKKEADRMKADYLDSNIFDLELEKKYLSKYKEAEIKLSNDKEIRIAQNSEIALFKKINFKKLIDIRRTNYSYLFENLKEIIHVIPGSYMYFMIKTENRDEIRKLCFSEGIFPAIHWLDIDLAKRKKKLSFHIDHRYELSDMNRILNILKKVSTVK